jgi:NAD(P) transhydrogenase
MTDSYDLIAIGSGPAGESATELAAFFGHRAAVIEKSRPGGTVTTTGGAPTKTLREAAVYFSGLREGDVYGVRISTPPEVATDIIRRRTYSVCELLQKVTAENISKNNVDYIKGTAHLDQSGTVNVIEDDGHQRKLRAKVILIATGSRPFHPTNISFDLPGVCDTDTILSRGRVPKEIVIIGGGPVGVEFATICHALGARVTLLERGTRLISMMDGELSRCMEDLFREWDIKMLFGVVADTVASKADQLEVTLSNGEQLFPDTVLFAAGRVANTEDLALEKAGVAVDSRGRIIVDANFRTSVDGIYAAGDVLGPTLASIAMEQDGGRLQCVLDPLRRYCGSSPVSAVYGMPEVSGAGLTEEQCQQQGLDYEVGRADLAFTPRSDRGPWGPAETDFLKSDRKLVGVHCIGDIASKLSGSDRWPSAVGAR